MFPQQTLHYQNICFLEAQTKPLKQQFHSLPYLWLGYLLDNIASRVTTPLSPALYTVNLTLQKHVCYVSVCIYLLAIAGDEGVECGYW